MLADDAAVAVRPVDDRGEDRRSRPLFDVPPDERGERRRSDQRRIPREQHQGSLRLPDHGLCLEQRVPGAQLRFLHCK